MSERTPTPWVYRQSKFDDWGWIRGPAADGERHGDLAAVAKGGDDTPFDEHRRNGTDPYAANATFIVKAVNSHEALMKALEEIAAIAEGSRTVNSLPHIAKIARGAIGVVGSASKD